MNKTKIAILGYRNPQIGIYRNKNSKKKIALATGCIGFSLVVPDLGIGMLIGLGMMSPCGIRNYIKYKLQDFKYFMKKTTFKLKYKWESRKND